MSPEYNPINSIHRVLESSAKVQRHTQLLDGLKIYSAPFQAVAQLPPTLHYQNVCYRHCHTTMQP